MDGGIMEAAAIASIAGSGLSLASMGMKAGGDVAAGYAKADEARVRGTNAMLQAKSQATNFKLRGETDSANYLMKGTSDSANYRYAAGQQAEQFGLESQRDLVQASEADTAAQFGKLQADMTDASARENLRAMLGNIAVTRAAGGADLTSPTTAALQGHVSDVANLNREAAVTSINAQTAEEKASADYLHQASAFALTQGGKARAMGEYNAINAENFGKYNADTARTMGDYNANTALQYGLFNAGAAGAAGNTAIDFGYANATTDILGGLGKAFSSGAFGLGGGAGGDAIAPEALTGRFAGPI